MTKIDLTEIEWTNSAIGLRAKTFESDGKQLRLAEFSRNFREIDWCEKNHIGFVIKGEIEIDFEDKTKFLKQDDELFICSNAKHKARATTENALLFLVERCLIQTRQTDFYQ